MPVTDKIREWIELGLMLSSGIPGITAGIMTFITQFFPKNVQAEWTEAKVRKFVADFRSRQDARLTEFNQRRTTDEEGTDTDE